MPTRIALLTPADLTRPDGSSLRPLAQAHGLWKIGFHDFVVFCSRPDAARPFPQERIRVHMGAAMEPERLRGFRVVHAHQNTGLCVRGRLWADFHGFAPIETAHALRARPLSPRAAAGWALSRWMTRRLLRRSERIICASASIAAAIESADPGAPPRHVVNNAVDPEAIGPATGTARGVVVIGGFTSRWGRTALPLALAVAGQCPEAEFTLVGTMSDSQATEARRHKNVMATGVVSDETLHEHVRAASVALLPFAPWCVGGGSRLKLLMVAAAGLPVVATPSALEGFEPREAALIGESPGELAAHIRALTGDAAMRRQRGEAMRGAIREQHDLLDQARRLAQLYDRFAR